METFHAFRASMNYCIEWRALALHPSDANRNQLVQEVTVTQLPALMAKVGIGDLILPPQRSPSPWHRLRPPISLPLSSHAIRRSLLNGAHPSFQARRTICSFFTHILLIRHQRWRSDPHPPKGLGQQAQVGSPASPPHPGWSPGDRSWQAGKGWSGS